MTINREPRIALELTTSQVDTLRFLLGIMDGDEFEHEADRANFLAICAQVDSATAQFAAING